MTTQILNDNSQYSFITVNDVMEIFGISKPTAYRIIQSLNNELIKDGLAVHPGKIPREYFEYRYGFRGKLWSKD